MLAERLAFSSATLTGLLAGAMLFLRVVLLPFWRGLPPAEFRAWFARHSGRIRALMVPLGVGAAGASLAATAARVANGEDARANAVAAASSGAVVTVTVTVNEPANREFVREDFGDERRPLSSRAGRAGTICAWRWDSSRPRRPLWAEGDASAATASGPPQWRAGHRLATQPSPSTTLVVLSIRARSSLTRARRARAEGL